LIRSLWVYLEYLRGDGDRSVQADAQAADQQTADRPRHGGNNGPHYKQLTNIYITNQSVIDATVAFFLFFTTIFEDDKRHRTAGYGPDEAICRLWYTKVKQVAALLTARGRIATNVHEFIGPV